MSIHRNISGFVLLLLLFYGLLAWPWEFVGDAYAVVYRGTMTAVFGSFGSNGVVRFREAPPNPQKILAGSACHDGRHE